MWGSTTGLCWGGGVQSPRASWERFLAPSLWMVQLTQGRGFGPAWEAHRPQRHSLQKRTEQLRSLLCFKRGRHSLALGHVSVAAGSANGLPMAAVFFGKSIAPSFLGHLGSKGPREAPLSIFELRCLSLDCQSCHCPLQRGNRQRGGVPGSRTPGPQVDWPPPPTQRARDHCLPIPPVDEWSDLQFQPTPRPPRVLPL